MVKTTLSGNRFELEARQETSGIGWTLKNTDEDMTGDDMTTEGTNRHLNDLAELQGQRTGLPHRSSGRPLRKTSTVLLRWLA
jgi:hypothetical protein